MFVYLFIIAVIPSESQSNAIILFFFLNDIHKDTLRITIDYAEKNARRLL